MSLETLIAQNSIDARVTAPVLDVVAPVFNEEIGLEPSVQPGRNPLPVAHPDHNPLPVAHPDHNPLPVAHPDHNPLPVAHPDRNPLPKAGVPTGLIGQLIRFAAVGVASTLAYLGLYALLRLGIGPQWANFTALLITAVANTAANRRLTFGVRGKGDAWRHQVQGLLVFAVGLGLTSGALALLDALATRPARPVELAVLIVANLLATAARFLLLRIWVFRSRRPEQQPA